MRALLATLVLAAVVGGSTARAAPSADGVFFRLPSNNIGCAYFARSLRCDILSGLRPQPRGRCELDWTGLGLRAAGRAYPVCAGDTAFDRRAPVLRYGSSWRRGGIVCVSRTTGLTCTNTARHGFVLSRQRWRLF